VIEEMFDAFIAENVGELMAWVVLTRQREALEPVVSAIAQVVRDISEPGDERPLDQATLGLVLIAIVLLLNAAAQYIRDWARVRYG
jgi:ABC-type phosphate transport system permease subunit